ncbi:MAG: DUF4037 domain-containing protein [Oscillospiraceae bacterium]|nr:DUF4037 domain-containing protein [Oscillospiraceae bacterium]
MQGLELSRRYFEAYGVPMLREQFPDWADRLAVGLAGSGSECFGYDDEISQDHDFEPGFCIFLPEEAVLDRKTAFQMERAYAALPKEYLGFSRPRLAPVGGSRRGVIRLGDFLEARTGSRDGTLTTDRWLRIEEQYLAEVVNGALFWEGDGVFASLRARLSRQPADVRKKKLAGRLLGMAQAGQYNYPRCLAHGEFAAAQLAVGEFVRHAIAAIFLLNERYLPYYKWQFRALRQLPILSEEAETLELLLTTDNGKTMAQAKQDMMENLAGGVIRALQAQGLTEAVCGDLEKHAWSVNDQIADPALRNAHILSAV